MLAVFLLQDSKNDLSCEKSASDSESGLCFPRFSTTHNRLVTTESEIKIPSMSFTHDFDFQK